MPAPHENRPISEHGVGVDDKFLASTGLAEPLSEGEKAFFEDEKRGDAEFEREWREEAESGVTSEPEPTPAEQQQTRLQQVEAERDQFRQNYAILEDRWNRLFAQAQAQAQAPQPAYQPQQSQQIPDPNVDPVGHWTARQRISEQRQAAIENHLAQQTQATQQQRQLTAQAQVIGAVQQRAAQSEEEVRKERPDYDDAVNYAVQRGHARLEALGYKDPQQRQQIITLQALEMAAGALLRNERPADVFYKFAQADGYQPNRYGRAAQERQERIRAGEKQARSLSQIGGRRPAGLTAQRALEETAGLTNPRDIAAAAKLFDSPAGRALLGG